MRLRGIASGLVWLAGAGAAGAGGEAWLAAEVDRLNLEGRRAPESAAAAFVDRAVDLPGFAELCFGDYLEDSLAELEGHMTRSAFRAYVEAHRGRLLETLRQRLVDDLGARLAGGLPTLEAAGSDFDGDTGRAEITVPGGGPIRCYLRRTEEGWRLRDLRLRDGRLSRIYRRRVEDVLDRRDSPAVLEARLAGREYIVLEDFSFSEPGGLPIGWGWRDRDDDAEKPYRVRRHGRDAFVEARVSDSSILILSLAQWNPRRYPILTWCWRADQLPEGGDERFGATNDSAAGVYVFYSLTWLGAPRHVKYVWSTTLPLDTVGRRNRIFRPWYIVAESGAENLGRWTFEAADLERDHGRTYGGAPKDRTVGLGLLTDANNTGTRAEACYGELRAWTREAWEQDRVVDHCGGLRGPPVLTGSTSREVTP